MSNEFSVAVASGTGINIANSMKLRSRWHDTNTRAYEWNQKPNKPAKSQAGISNSKSPKASLYFNLPLKMKMNEWMSSKLQSARKSQIYFAEWMQTNGLGLVRCWKYFDLTSAILTWLELITRSFFKAGLYDMTWLKSGTPTHLGIQSQRQIRSLAWAWDAWDEFLRKGGYDYLT